MAKTTKTTEVSRKMYISVYLGLSEVEELMNLEKPISVSNIFEFVDLENCEIYETEKEAIDDIEDDTDSYLIMCVELVSLKTNMIPSKRPFKELPIK